MNYVLKILSSKVDPLYFTQINCHKLFHVTCSAQGLHNIYRLNCHEAYPGRKAQKSATSKSRRMNLFALNEDIT